MTSGPFQRLSDRDRGAAPVQVLHEGVPDHLDQPLRRWIYQALSGGGSELVALRLAIQIDYHRAGNGAAFLALDPQQDELLDVADAILACGGPWPPPREWDQPGQNSNHVLLTQLRKALPLILDAGASAWRVRDDGTGLTRRVDGTAAAAADATVAAAAGKPGTGSASSQIQAAWGKLYQLHPEPPAAYREAVRAVESSAQAVIEPNNSGATLGTMLGQLRSAPGRYRLAIPGPDGTGNMQPLMAMIEMLWKGQTSRHGGQQPERPETFAEAQMAVHLAVTLVHWFATGAVSRQR